MGKGRVGSSLRTLQWLPWVLAGAMPAISAAQPGFVGTKFTYQGQLKFNGTPANGPYDFQFKLVKIFSIQVGSTLTLEDVDVENGLFTVTLDFGDNFNNESRWLDISVRTGASVGAFTHLLPQQELTATPFSLYSLKSACCTLDGAYDATPSGPRVINVDDGPVALQVAGGIAGMTINGPLSGSTRALSVFAATTGDVFNAYNDGGGNAGVFTSSGGSAGRFTNTSSTSSGNCVAISTNGNSTSQALNATHTGLGDCGLFTINNAGNAGEALEARTNGSGDALQAVNTGTGRAAFFQTGNASSSANCVAITTNGNANSQAVSATHTGLGDCSLFTINNASNAGEAVEASSNGSGDVVHATNTGTGRAGYFLVNNDASTATALYVQTTGTGLAVHTEGKVGIGTASVPTGVLMAVDGKILCEELEVQLSQDWPDYVFEDDYQLMPLKKVEEHVREKGHLPGIPSAAEIKSKGVAVGDMQARLLEKVEELTLHMINQNKRLDEVTQENERLRERIAALESTNQ